MSFYTTAIIVAAGNSTRMGGEMSKIFINLLGKPAIFHTVKAFNEAKNIDEIVLVCRDQDKTFLGKILYDVSGKIKCIVEGGETRQKSVFNGVKSACDKATHFSIHDGARALITPKLIDDVIKHAFLSGASTLGIPVNDTIKVIDDQGYIDYTPSRSKLRAIQTPQVFEKSLYLKALAKAEESGCSYTDDCQLIENMQGKVYVCMGDYSNIKLTTKEDVILAEKILKSRKEDEGYEDRARI